jgi:hypothetical protein
MQDQAELQAESSASPTEVDLSTWYNQAEACTKLHMSKRWFNEQIRDGVLNIEKRMRDKIGLRGRGAHSTEPCYNPRDVDNVVEMKRPKTPVFPPSVEPARSPAAAETAVTIDTALLLERLFGLLERKLPALPPPPPPDRGPWLTIDQAAEHTKLPVSLVRSAVRRMHAEHRPDVILHGRYLVRQAAIAELNAHELRGSCADDDHCAEPLLVKKRA